MGVASSLTKISWLIGQKMDDRKKKPAPSRDWLLWSEVEGREER
jgi:hypothetical protein